jgi:hypothetical protein
MKDFPALPPLSDAPDELLASGHLWILELVDGAWFRFGLDDAGVVRFGDERRVYGDPDSVPESYRHAVRHVRESLDRDALRAAVPNVEDVVFFGVATTRRSIAYDWTRTPSFLGYDVWSADAGEFRPPDAAEQIFDRLGLHPVNAFEKERNTRDFDPDGYEVPDSAWYDGPAKGVVVRNKRGKGGQRATFGHPDFREKTVVKPVEGDADGVAANLVPRERFERIAAELETRGRPVTVDSVYERALEAAFRESHARLHHHESDVDPAAFRSAVAARTRAFLQRRG